jgi:uncharacterized repeat protein (TIGR01451 family)
MRNFAYLITAAALAVAAPALAGDGPLQVASKVLVEQRTAAADGTVRTALVPAKRAVPGDRVVFALAYRNTGTKPISDVVFNNPVPAGIAYRAPAQGSPSPDLSVDGKNFGPLGSLRVGARAATAADVTHVRWRLASPIAPGGQGQLAFQAILK